MACAPLGEGYTSLMLGIFRNAGSRTQADVLLVRIRALEDRLAVLDARVERIEMAKPAAVKTTPAPRRSFRSGEKWEKDVDWDRVDNGGGDGIPRA